MSDVTKAAMAVVVGPPDDQSAATKVVLYLARSSALYVPPRRIVHGKISYSKRVV